VIAFPALSQKLDFDPAQFYSHRIIAGSPEGAASILGFLPEKRAHSSIFPCVWPVASFQRQTELFLPA